MKFRVIAADPPWTVKRGSQYSWREGRASGTRRDLDYPTMTVSELCAADVGAVAADDAALFLWTTQTFLEQSFEVLRAWGFEHSCTCVWVKDPHGWGPGGDFQSTVEFCLYGRRGRGARKDGRGQIAQQWWNWPRGAHSAKPDAFLDMVETEFEGPYLELFARRARLGPWHYAGNESLGTVVVEGIA